MNVYHRDKVTIRGRITGMSESGKFTNRRIKRIGNDQRHGRSACGDQDGKKKAAAAVEVIIREQDDQVRQLRTRSSEMLVAENISRMLFTLRKIDTSVFQQDQCYDQGCMKLSYAIEYLMI
ncbi:uncharacterized protein [Panulirus ornatus]|uniref:uncharacterized protein n=1 Tax=Panulirus ornatus TaxID=150431 RepID=UPI003A83CBB6